MSADIWMKKDIANALLATYQSTCETAAAIGVDPARKAAFLAGQRSALSTLALFFGISPGSVMPERRELERG